MLNVALSHDIDRTKKTYQFVTKFFRALFLLDPVSARNQVYTWFQKNNYWTFDDILEIEKSFNARSTFFFLNESIRVNPLDLQSYVLALGRYKISDRKIRELIRRIDRSGWEIGVHGSYNSFKDEILLRKEKETLEEIVGHEIIGIRQHYLNLDDRSWEIQRKVGFKYDSSYGFVESIGFKNNNVKPFFPFQDDFLEIPMVIMDTSFINDPDPWKHLEEIINICEQNNAYLVINFHNHVFNEREFPGYRTAYIKMLEIFKKRRANFCTLSEIYNSYSSLKGKTDNVRNSGNNKL